MARGGKREGSGRKPGSPNKLTIKLKGTLTELAQEHTVEAFQTQLDILRNPKAPPAVRAAVSNSILDRGWGKASQLLEHSGKDGTSIKHRITVEFIGGEPEDSGGLPPTVQTSEA